MSGFLLSLQRFDTTEVAEGGAIVSIYSMTVCVSTNTAIC
jgi:hypothetical protein